MLPDPPPTPAPTPPPTVPPPQAVLGGGCLDLVQTAASTVTASIVAVRCLVDVTSLKLFAPELYLCKTQTTSAN